MTEVVRRRSRQSSKLDTLLIVLAVMCGTFAIAWPVAAWLLPQDEGVTQPTAPVDADFEYASPRQTVADTDAAGAMPEAPSGAGDPTRPLTPVDPSVFATMRPPASVSVGEGLPHLGEPRDPIDPEQLLYGGSGAAGAIMRGPGIVESSAFPTSWSIMIPSAGARAAVVEVGPTPTGGLGATDNPETVGWWRYGPEPGGIGNVLLNGHRDFRDTDNNTGPGVAWLLPEVEPGDPIYITNRATGVIYVYAVTESLAVPWDDPAAVEQYLTPSEDSVLTFFTCEGSFDRPNHNYSHRRVVRAHLVDAVLTG